MKGYVDSRNTCLIIGEDVCFGILTSYLFFGGMMRKEAAYQAGLIKRLKKLFPGCFVLKTDPAQTQGIPDLLLLVGSKWAMLEVKEAEGAPVRPNQPHYVKKFGQMSYASFIYPENEKDVLRDLQRTLGSS